ncbi:acyl-CoA dehydrogenase [Streptomyces sp. NPDC087917]|uniref:acyl-CoA dehydrogenase family protein n=1 Tax=Streptomyces sp. NPDC087917 TaxID=3155060 RepID=UPI003425D4A1
MSAMTVKAPLADEAEALKCVLFGEQAEQELLHTPWRRLLSARAFRRTSWQSAEEHLEWVYDRLRLLGDAIPEPLELVGDPVGLACLHEWLCFVDPTLTALITIHYNLFLGSLTAADETRDLTPYTSMRQLGTFLLTEVAHGNDAAAVETTAVYDRTTDTFTLDTPNAGAQKFISNTSPAGGPKTGLVGARLILDGADQGVFLFVVPLTDGAGVLPGVRVRRLPARLGSPHDHCLTSFDAVRVPREAMLGGRHGRITGEGVFVSEVPERRHRFMASIDRVMTGRICLSAGTVGATRAGLVMAVRYGHNRHITGLTESSRIPVFALRSHHGPLVEAIATVYAMNMLYREAARRWSRRARGDGGEAALFVSVAKAWITWQGRGVGAQIRERCGAQGLLVHNGIVTQLMAVEGAVTAEGDNQAIMAQAAAELLLRHRPGHLPAHPPGRSLDDAGFLGELLAAAEMIWLDRARQARRSAPAEALARRNHAMGPALRAANLYAERHAAEALADAVAQMPDGPGRELLATVHLLFALRTVASHSGDLLRHGLLTGEQFDELPVLVERLVAELAPQAEVLVEAFAVPEEFFEGMPIAAPDYIAAYDHPDGPWHRHAPAESAP